MIDIMHWTDTPSGRERALQFFRQHPKGVRVALDRHTPGLRPKFAGDPGVPSTSHFIVTTGDGVARWCSTGKHWTWDGRWFSAEVCGPACTG